MVLSVGVYPFLILSPVYALYLAYQPLAPGYVVRMSLGTVIAGLAMLGLLAVLEPRSSHKIGLGLIAVVAMGATFALTKRKVILLALLCGTVLSVHTPFVWADKRRDMEQALAQYTSDRRICRRSCLNCAGATVQWIYR